MPLFQDLVITYVIAGEYCSVRGVEVYLPVVHLEVARLEGPVPVLRPPAQHHGGVRHVDRPQVLDWRRELGGSLLEAGVDLPHVGQALAEVGARGFLVHGLAQRLAALWHSSSENMISICTKKIINQYFLIYVEMLSSILHIQSM